MKFSWRWRIKRKKCSMVSFFIFVRKTINRNGFQRIWIRPLQDFEKLPKKLQNTFNLFLALNSEPKSTHFITFYFLFATALQKNWNFYNCHWNGSSKALNLDWGKCKIFLGSNFLLVARFVCVLSCIRPKKRHPKEPVVPEEKKFNLSQIYSGPYLPKDFIDSRLSGRLTPAVSGRKRPF